MATQPWTWPGERAQIRKSKAVQRSDRRPRRLSCPVRRSRSLVPKEVDRTIQCKAIVEPERSDARCFSNREPDEWLATLADRMRAQAAIDRFSSNTYDLVIEGESYRQRLKPKL